MPEGKWRWGQFLGSPHQWISRAVVLLATLLACASSRAAPFHPWPVSGTAEPLLGAMEMRALHDGAYGHPYSTVALLYLLHDAAVMKDGALYLESVPKATLTSALLAGRADADSIETLLKTLQWSPYSDSEFFVEVRWSVRRIKSDTEMIDFHTQLLHEGAVFHHPSIESDMTVALSNGELCFLPPAKEM